MAQVSYSTAVRSDRDAVLDVVPDEDLLASLRAGDELVFAKLVDAWSPTMLRVARTYVASRQSAEDVVQDAWLGVVNGIAKFEGRSSLRTWVFSILVNRARTRGAREARTVMWPRLDDDGPAVDPERFQGTDGQHPGQWTSAGAPSPWGTHPESEVLSREVLRLLGQVLSTLPPRQRRVITMRDVGGFAAEEVCAALDISPQNQRVLLHRARCVLRNALEEYYRG